MAEASTFGVTTAQFAKPQLSMAFCRLKTQRTCITAENDGDQMRAIALGRGGEAMPRLAGRAGFQPGRALKKANHLVGVHKLRFPAAQAIHPDCRIILNLLMLEQLRAHQRNIIGRGYMILRGVIKARAIFKMRILHAKLSGALIAHGDEHFLTACQSSAKATQASFAEPTAVAFNSSSTVMTSPSLSQI